MAVGHGFAVEVEATLLEHTGLRGRAAHVHRCLVGLIEEAAEEASHVSIWGPCGGGGGSPVNGFGGAHAAGRRRRGHDSEPTACGRSGARGIAQGVAQALMEEIRYDDQGNLLTSDFMDYAVISSMAGREVQH